MVRIQREGGQDMDGYQAKQGHSPGLHVSCIYNFLPFYVLRVHLIRLPSSIYGQCCICHCRLPGSYCMASLIPNDCTVTLVGTSAAIKENPPSTDFRLFFLPYLLKLCMCMTHLLEFSELDWLGTGYLVYTRGSIR